MMKKAKVLLFFLSCLAVMTAQKAPDFTITDFNNQTHKLYEDYLDKGKVVMIKIMFASCPPCNSSAPRIQELYEDFGEGSEDVQFFALSNKSWDNNAGIEAFADKHDLTFPGAGTDGGALSAVSPYTSGMFGSFFGTPTYVVIDPKGNVNFKVPRQDLEEAIEDALDDNNGGGCANAFEGSVDGNDGLPSAFLRSDIIGSQVYELEVDTSDGSFEYNCEFTFPPQALEYSLSIEADGNDVEGVTVKDILIIIRHLLGVKALESTEMKIAADYTANGFLSVRDISEIRKLILGVHPDNPHHNSWIFWHETSDFSQDSSGILIPDLITSVPLMDVVDSVLLANFEGVKLGDVSGDINTFFTQTQTRGSENVALTYRDQWVEAGQVGSMTIDNWPMDLVGFQMALKGDVDITNVEISHSDLHLSHSLVHHQNRIIAYHPTADVSGPNVKLQINFVPHRSGYISELIALDDDFPAAAESEVTLEPGEENRLSSLAIQLAPLKEQTELNLFPNPGNGELNIVAKSPIVDVQLYSVHGSTVGNIRELLGLGDTHVKLRLTDRSSGIYLLSILQENGLREVRKVQVK